MEVLIEYEGYRDSTTSRPKFESGRSIQVLFDLCLETALQETCMSGATNVAKWKCARLTTGIGGYLMNEASVHTDHAPS